ncbi:MAG TPA: hypothetical protein PK291_01620, partial [Thermotogota bacterium]|nr:hypothetical protein [Thermotogota bacterium]
LSRGNQRDPAMLVRGNRGVTEGTPRSPFCSLYTAMMSRYRAVAKRKGAYAAMTVRSYRGVTSGLTSEAHEVSRY